MSRRFHALSVAAIIVGCFCGCALTQQARMKDFDRQRQQRTNYLLSLIYSQAPELRREPLVFMNAHWGSPPPGNSDIRTAQDLEARFRFARDGDATYRFVHLERSSPDPSKPPKIALTIGRERATHVIEERPYRRKSE